ncbi:hypothetical protein BD626DRAFT_494217 [Schizophyllum amplum]|uniref:Uncharacterized protein n=1 Tax=Schizophyllum amplum TaxID=97359 RepID=A0A550CF09_9AGAR|nr:hypothetical protein BD626DRAFT_494217 [Auriculariopsis ampla]
MMCCCRASQSAVRQACRRLIRGAKCLGRYCEVDVSFSNSGTKGRKEIVSHCQCYERAAPVRRET